MCQQRPWILHLGSYLLLVSTELATQNDPGTTAHASFNPDIFYVTSFICGNAEASFRSLVKRITDTVFGPGNSPPRVDNNAQDPNA